MIPDAESGIFYFECVCVPDRVGLYSRIQNCFDLIHFSTSNNSDSFRSFPLKTEGFEIYPGWHGRCAQDRCEKYALTYVYYKEVAHK
jgi:hypothetical protein